MERSSRLPRLQPLAPRTFCCCAECRDADYPYDHDGCPKTPVFSPRVNCGPVSPVELLTFD